jgi:hypothetical protein
MTRTGGHQRRGAGGRNSRRRLPARVMVSQLRLVNATTARPRATKESWVMRICSEGLMGTPCQNEKCQFLRDVSEGTSVSNQRKTPAPGRASAQCGGTGCE